MPRTVTIDCFPEAVARHRHSDAIIAIDVIRATTTAVTAVALGWDCYPAPSIEATVPLAARLHDPLLVGELGGSKPFGFHLNNSPAGVARREDVHRPIILLSTSGTRVICAASDQQAMYVACLRNYSAVAKAVAAMHEHVVLIGAGSRGEFREEDQLGCAWLCDLLIDEGFAFGSGTTRSIVKRWRGRPVTDIVAGASARYLMRSGQTDDLDFVLNHVDDLDGVYRYDGERIVDHKQVKQETAA